jgi:DNA helicase-2/ATP-dependent DNA helicase PcrA
MHFCSGGLRGSDNRMTPSKYQQAIFDWVQHGKGDAAVNAVAGSGKTTTLVQAASLVPPGDLLFLAFNKAIVEELQRRLPATAQVQTLNSLGHRALGKHLDVRLQLDNHKYDDIAADLLKNEAIPGGEAFGETKRAVKQLVSFAQSTLANTDDESLAELADSFGVNIDIKGVWESTIYAVVRECLRIGEQEGTKGRISFDDQIWLPVLWGVKPAKALFTFVDECQDLSAAKLELALSAGHPTKGRRLLVGDPRQAIYGFAGADAESFNKIVERTKATVLPLSVSYRCPISVVAAAKAIVPSIEYAQDAPTGHVGAFDQSKLGESLKSGDLVLCRLTAPLVRLCIQLIRQKVPARVKGRDIGKALVATAREALGGGDWGQFGALLDVYKEAKSAKLKLRKHAESQLQALDDKVEGVRACYESFESRSIFEFQAQVEGLFSDTGAVIELSTIHRASCL